MLELAERTAAAHPFPDGGKSNGMGDADTDLLQDFNPGHEDADIQILLGDMLCHGFGSGAVGTQRSP